MRRRDFLSSMSLVAGLVVSRRAYAYAAPAFKSILDYGAKPDGKTLNSKAIQRAIDDASRAGGGTVNVPPGIFVTGRIELKSGVTLNLEAGCTLLGSKSINDYDATSGNAGNPRHLIFAMNAEDVVLSGPGRIDGQGSAFWEPSGRPRFRRISSGPMWLLTIWQ